MFAKVFTQIFDSSIAEDYRVRLVFEDFLKLADKDGRVDMTPASIARRTHVPLRIVLKGIAELEKPDPTSRTPDQDGRRIVRLDAHRDWGWLIVNYGKYRESATREMLRMAETERKREWRRLKSLPPTPTPPTPEEDVQIKNKKQRDDENVRTCPGHLPYGEVSERLCRLFKRPADNIRAYDEQYALAEIAQRPAVLDELTELESWKLRTQFFPRSIKSLLENWDKTLDASRNEPAESNPHSDALARRIGSL